MALDAFDRALIAATQAGLPLVPRPYDAVGATLGVSGCTPPWCAALARCPTTTSWALPPTA